MQGIPRVAVFGVGGIAHPMFRCIAPNFFNELTLKSVHFGKARLLLRFCSTIQHPSMALAYPVF